MSFFLATLLVSSRIDFLAVVRLWLVMIAILLVQGDKIRLSLSTGILVIGFISFRVGVTGW